MKTMNNGHLVDGIKSDGYTIDAFSAEVLVLQIWHEYHDEMQHFNNHAVIAVCFLRAKI